MAILQERIHVIVWARLPWHKFSMSLEDIPIRVHSWINVTFAYAELRDRSECLYPESLFPSDVTLKKFRIIKFQLNALV